MSAIGRRLTRFLAVVREGRDCYFLDLEGYLIEVWSGGWAIVESLPVDAKPLEIPNYVTERAVISMKGYESLDDGTQVIFSNEAALKIYIFDMTGDGTVWHFYRFYEPEEMRRLLKPTFSSIEDEVVQSE
jgi:hypothetical protein